MKRIEKFLKEIRKYNLSIDFDFDVKHYINVEYLKNKLKNIENILMLLPIPECICDIKINVNYSMSGQYGITLSHSDNNINMTVNPSYFVELDNLILQIKPMSHQKTKEDIKNHRITTFQHDIEGFTIIALKNLKRKIKDRIEFLEEEIE